MSWLEPRSPPGCDAATWMLTKEASTWNDTEEILIPILYCHESVPMGDCWFFPVGRAFFAPSPSGGQWSGRTMIRCLSVHSLPSLRGGAAAPCGLRAAPVLRLGLKEGKAEQSCSKGDTLGTAPLSYPCMRGWRGKSKTDQKRRSFSLEVAARKYGRRKLKGMKPIGESCCREGV